jgi:hypothetical protein
MVFKKRTLSSVDSYGAKKSGRSISLSTDLQHFKELAEAFKVYNE